MQLQNLSELRINLVLALRSGTVPATPNTELTIKNLTRHIFLFGKFFRRLQQLDVARFVTLPISSDLILYYWNKVVQATNSPREYTEGKDGFYVALENYMLICECRRFVYSCIPCTFLGAGHGAVQG